MIPLPYRLFGLAMLIAAAFGTGWFQGRSKGIAELTMFRAEVESEAKLQTARNELEKRKQEQTTKEIVNGYSESIMALRRDNCIGLPVDQCRAGGVPAGATGSGGTPQRTEESRIDKAFRERCLEDSMRLWYLQRWAKDSGMMKEGD